ncbi:MAG: endonuclease V [bacterium]
MKIKKIHSWDVTVGKAKLLQMEVASQISQVSAIKDIAEIKRIGACDIAYSKNGKKVYAVCLIYTFPDLKLLERKILKKEVKKMFPYVPGYLSFREAPILLELLKKISKIPDVLIMDGHGIAHPRGVGLASHIGLFLDIPTIGCAKSLLYGHTQEPPPGVKGAYTFIKDDGGSLIGMTLRTREYKNPVYVSVGNKLNLDMATDIIMKLLGKYRIPEPIRQADLETKRIKISRK